MQISTFIFCHKGALPTLTPLSLFVACQQAPEKEAWVPLFNRENLDGWDIKIRGHELNDNYANTFRVEDGMLVVAYDGYEDFGNRSYLFLLRSRCSVARAYRQIMKTLGAD